MSMQTKNKFEVLIEALGPGVWVTQKALPELTGLAPLCQCLVRCGGCRFICAAQDVPTMIKAIEAIGDYVRDVSITAGEIERAGEWTDEFRVWECAPPVELLGERSKYCPKCGRYTGDGPCNYYHPPANPFREEDCGGVFDGNQVTSDADPGL